MAQIAIGIPWQPRHAHTLMERAHVADESGVHSIWVNEGFGHDAFSGLTLLTQHTARARLGTAIVNVFSRTPGALAQHFATLDELSEGRVIVGLGSSAPGAIERFHGVPFRDGVARLGEAVALIRAYWRHERSPHHGPTIDLERPLPMGVEPVQATPPIYLATLHPRSVRLTAEVADGWLPAWIPLDGLAGAVDRLRAHARRAGRDPSALTVRAPGTVTVVDDPERAAALRAARTETLAFFVARNGEFYYRQFGRHGLADEAAAIRRAWDEGGREAAVAVVPDGLIDRFDFAGPLDACTERIAEQAAAGVDLHQVHVEAGDLREYGRVIARLAQS